MSRSLVAVVLVTLPVLALLAALTVEVCLAVVTIVLMTFVGLRSVVIIVVVAAVVNYYTWLNRALCLLWFARQYDSGFKLWRFLIEIPHNSRYVLGGSQCNAPELILFLLEILVTLDIFELSAEQIRVLPGPYS